MAVVVDPKDVDEFLGYAKEENLEAVKVAVVTEDPRLVLSWRGKDVYKRQTPTRIKRIWFFGSPTIVSFTSDMPVYTRYAPIAAMMICFVLDVI